MQTRTINHDTHVDTEELRPTTGGTLVWAVVKCEPRKTRKENDMTPVGVPNGNWRGREMREYVRDLNMGQKKLVELGTCGHELKNRPLWMVGKINICLDCYEAEKSEQARLAESITEQAQADYFSELGPQEPPAGDYRIYNRKQADGTYPPLSKFFEDAVIKADAGKAQIVDGVSWQARAEAEHRDWLDEKRTQEDARI